MYSWSDACICIVQIGHKEDHVHCLTELQGHSDLGVTALCHYCAIVLQRLMIEDDLCFLAGIISFLTRAGKSGVLTPVS